jgi:hypothetical protein
MSSCRRAKPETSRFVMTNLEDTNRGCRTGARKTRAWPTTDPTKTCSDHPLDRQTRPPRTTLLSFGTCWNRVMCCRRAPCPTPFQYPQSYPVLSYQLVQHRFCCGAAAVLLCGTALCAAVTSDPPVRFGPVIGPTPYDAKQYPAEIFPFISS